MDTTREVFQMEKSYTEQDILMDRLMRNIASGVSVNLDDKELKLIRTALIEAYEAGTVFDTFSEWDITYGDGLDPLEDYPFDEVHPWDKDSGQSS